MLCSAVICTQLHMLKKTLSERWQTVIKLWPQCWVTGQIEAQLQSITNTGCVCVLLLVLMSMFKNEPKGPVTFSHQKKWFSLVFSICDVDIQTKLSFQSCKSRIGGYSSRKETSRGFFKTAWRGNLCCKQSCCARNAPKYQLAEVGTCEAERIGH